MTMRHLATMSVSEARIELSVSSAATTDEIKKRFLELAKKTHPDVSKEPNATENFARLGNALEALLPTSNPISVPESESEAGNDELFSQL